MSHESAVEESFDSLYRATRRGVLLAALAATGDVRAAEGGVRDAYVDAWRRWRSVARLDDPAAWIRARAEKLARRRHALRPWHRLFPLPDAQLAALEALAAQPVADAADPAGESAEGLDQLLDSVTLPRAARLRRMGRTSPRRHLVVAAVSATVLTIGVGALASGPEDTSARELSLVKPSPSARQAVERSAMMPTADDLLYAEQMSRFGPSRTWHTSRTSNNTTGDGLNTVCQQDRFADPKGYSALVRSFRAFGSPKRTAVQTIEISRSAKAAAQAFRTTVGWYAGCQVARVQVVDAYHVDHVGDQADVLTLRVGRHPVSTVSVAVGRTGAVTTSTVGAASGGTPPPIKEVTRSLGEAVEKLCARTGSPGCVGTPSFRAVPPPPTGDERGLLSVADLPAVGRIDRPWVGTKPVTPSRNPAATSCDEAGFAGAGATKRRSRTYLVPQADVPARFGLTETYGRFPDSKSATRFLTQVRTHVAGCEKRDLATRVDRGASVRGPVSDRSTWQLTTDVSKTEKVRFRVGFVQVGRRVAEVTFAPSSTDDMTSASFDQLAFRAGQRLRELH